MAFVFELKFSAPHRYVHDFIVSSAESEGVKISVVQSGGAVTLVGDEKDPKLAPFLEKLGATLPASLYMEGSRHRLVEGGVPDIKTPKAEALPVSIGLCTRCMKEIFDPSSRRYYYPFTMCRCCGPQYALFEHYPFEREGTLLRFFIPCEACTEESVRNPFRRDFPLVTCHECGVPVRMTDRKNERYANDAGSFKTLFEVAARAVAKGKSVRVKTLAGWRLFFDASQVSLKGEKWMMALDAARLPHHCALLDVERNALLSIERPLLRASVAEEELREVYGDTTLLAYPDEGFTILLARELTALGYSHVAVRECDETDEADFVIDYDLATDPQRSSRLFINKAVKFFVEGERGIFPQRRPGRSERIVAAHGMAAVPEGENVVIDRMEKFDTAEASQLWLLEGEEAALSHSDTRRFTQEIASVMSVLAEHDRSDASAVGVYFHDEPTFVYHNGRQPIVAVPAMAFDGPGLREHLVTLREGSARLVANFEAKFPETAAALFGGVADIFEAASLIMGLEERGIDAVGEAALRFGGKGGVQVDTKVKNNRFDPYAFVASLMSYRLAGTDTPLLAYSIFESFGDYVAEVVTSLKARADAKEIVLCGRAFGNPSLFSRVQKKLGTKAFLMNETLPIDRENALLGALAL